MNKKICVVGAGQWGKNHIRTLHNLGALGGIVECAEEVRVDLAEQYPGIPIHHRIKGALAVGYDGYILAIPAETHFEKGKQLLEHGQPVLIEKPMALKTAHAAELVALAAAEKTTLMVGHVLLFHPAIQKIRELVKKDKIGRLQYLYSNRINLGTVRTEENVFWSFAPHDISIFDYFIGSAPKRVHTSGGAFLQPDIHDTTMTSLEYGSNIKAHIFVSWLHPFKEHRLVVIGSKGMLSFEDSSESKDILFYEKGIDWIDGKPVKRDGPTEIIPYDRGMPLTNEIQYFIDHLEGGAEIADGRNGLEVVKVLEAATILLESEQSAPSDISALLSYSEDSSSKPNTRSTNSEVHDSIDYFVHNSAYVDENVLLGTGTRVWHFSHVQSGSQIGKNCSIGQNVNIGNNVHIGNQVKIQNNVSVYEGVELEDYVFCGPSMVFTNILAPRSKYPQRGSEFYLRTRVREGATIGANATIVCGNTVGKHALIGAGSVVAGDVLDHALMVGVPARRIGWVCECGTRLGPSLECSKCERKYKVTDTGLMEISG